VIKAEKTGAVGMDSINKQFPAWQKQIEQLYQENEVFQEMCQDYEEVRSLLETWTASNEINPVIIDEYRTLLKELEAEIIETLHTRFQLIEIEQGGDGADLSETQTCLCYGNTLGKVAKFHK
jgi:hypothetical protein